jgi:23S rRNA pseudouridine2605 synthase
MFRQLVRKSAPPQVRKVRPVGKAAEGCRINKFLAHCGAARSRRDAEIVLAAGKVTVNGVQAHIGQVLKAGDTVELDSKPLKLPYAHSTEARVWLYHKTPGQLVAHGKLPRSIVAEKKKDPAMRFSSIFEHIKRNFPSVPKLTAAGRLDANTEGLMVLSNNPALCRVLELPSNAIQRTYRVRVFGQLLDSKLKRLSAGITVKGTRYKPMQVSVSRRGSNNSWLEVTVTEGKNREVREALEAIGLKVSRLIRTRFGPYELGGLSPGSLKEVTLDSDLRRRLSVK